MKSLVYTFGVLLAYSYYCTCALPLLLLYTYMCVFPLRPSQRNNDPTVILPRVSKRVYT